MYTKYGSSLENNPNSFRQNLNDKKDISYQDIEITEVNNFLEKFFDKYNTEEKSYVKNQNLEKINFNQSGKCNAKYTKKISNNDSNGSNKLASIFSNFASKNISKNHYHSDSYNNKVKGTYTLNVQNKHSNNENNFTNNGGFSTNKLFNIDTQEGYYNHKSSGSIFYAKKPTKLSNFSGYLDAKVQNKLNKVKHSNFYIKKDNYNNIDSTYVNNKNTDHYSSNNSNSYNSLNDLKGCSRNVGSLNKYYSSNNSNSYNSLNDLKGYSRNVGSLNKYYSSNNSNSYNSLNDLKGYSRKAGSLNKYYNSNNSNSNNSF